MEYRPSYPSKRARMTCAFGHLSVSGALNERHARDHRPGCMDWIGDQHVMQQQPLPRMLAATIEAAPERTV